TRVYAQMAELLPSLEIQLVAVRVPGDADRLLVDGAAGRGVQDPVPGAGHRINLPHVDAFVGIVVDVCFLDLSVIDDELADGARIGDPRRIRAEGIPVRRGRVN